jgi:serine/threonine protein phosphatase PrpC
VVNHDPPPIVRAPYFTIPSGNGIMPTRSLGDHQFTNWGMSHEPEVTTAVLAPGFLLAACDGLWDVVQVEELGRLTRGCATAQEVADTLGRVALDERHTGDNVTVLVVQIP